MPRKNKFKAQQVIDAITKAKGILVVAAKSLGCSRTTVYNYMNKYPTVQAAYDEINESALDFAEGKLMELIRAGNLTAIIFYLKTKGKKRGYVEQKAVEQIGEITINVKRQRN